jgi:hypothetical protein
MKSQINTRLIRDFRDKSMSSLVLTGNTPAQTYNKILIVNNPDLTSTTGVDGTLRLITDGSGAATPIAVSSTQVMINNVIWPPLGTNVATAYLQISSTTGQAQWHVLDQQDVDTALGYTPANVAGDSFTGPTSIMAATMETVATAVTTTTATTVYELETTTGGTVKAVCQVNDSATGTLQAEEMLIVSDSSGIDYTSYGVVQTGNPLGIFTAVMSGSNVLIQFQAASATAKTVTVMITSMLGVASE